MRNFVQALRIYFFIIIIVGVAYEISLTFIGYNFFSNYAGGSLMHKDDKVIGSELIAQKFEGSGYFVSRLVDLPNGIFVVGDNPQNLHITTEEFHARKQKFKQYAIWQFQKENIPSDLITASGSGLDPHISKDSAYYQIPSVAKARNITQSELKEIVDKNIQKPFLYIWGRERVNVLKLNMELDTILKVE